MSKVCLYFQVHQPNRLIPYDFFQIGEHAFYENDALNAEILERVAERCYLPANAMFSRLLTAQQGDFKMTLSLSGVFIEQCEHHHPAVIESFRKLVETGHVEILSETYHHSLACLVSAKEFEAQVELHREKVREVFGIEPTVFRNTELIYNNALAAHCEALGFKGIIAEGIPALLGDLSPNRLYRAPNADSIVTLTRHRSLSDDVAFRRTDTSWPEYPLKPGTYARWLSEEGGDTINLFMDYESIGEHQDAGTGVFEFWPEMIEEALKRGVGFTNPSELIDEAEVAGVYDAHGWTSWADHECDLSAWKGNVMQGEAFSKINRLGEAVSERDDDDLTHVWRKLQTSDHFYYMSTKTGTDGEVHKHFSPYSSPYDAYIFYMNALSDLQLRVQRTPLKNGGRKP